VAVAASLESSEAHQREIFALIGCIMRAHPGKRRCTGRTAAVAAEGVRPNMAMLGRVYAPTGLQETGLQALISRSGHFCHKAFAMARPTLPDLRATPCQSKLSQSLLMRTLSQLSTSECSVQSGRTTRARTCANGLCNGSPSRSPSRSCVQEATPAREATRGRQRHELQI
jgi:hypothetical protein